MTLMPCGNFVNPRPITEHCPFHNMTEHEEKEFSFEYAGNTFRPLKPISQCEACATVMAKRWFDKFFGKLLVEKDGKLSVRWAYLRKLRRAKKDQWARAIPQFDDVYKALQTLHDIGKFTRDAAIGWEVRDLSGIGDGSHVSPSWYKQHKLYFVELKDAFDFAKACLSLKQGFYRFEIRRGDIVYSDTTVLGVEK